MNLFRRIGSALKRNQPTVASQSLESSTHTSSVSQPSELRTVLARHPDQFQSVAYSPDGTHLATGSIDSRIRLWEVASGRLLRTLEGHSNSVDSVAWSPNGRQLASGSDDSTVRLWDCDSGRLLRTLEGHSRSVTSVAWSPNGRQLASGSLDDTVRLWDCDRGRLLRTVGGHSSFVISVAWSPNGRQLASGSFDKAVRLWDLDSGRLLRTLEGHRDWVRSVAWSPDSRQVASGSDDSTVRLWDCDSGRLLRTLEGHSSWVRSVAWSPDGRQLASGSDDKTVRLWDCDSGCLLRTFEGHRSSVDSVAWSPNGRQLASGSDDSTVRLWDCDSGRLLRTLEGNRDWVRSMAWSPDGRQLASGSDDSTVRLWDCGSGRLLRALEGHSRSVTSVTWSPDGRQLASGSNDKTVRLWDCDSGRLLRTLEGHGDWVRSVAWSPDGRQVVSGSDDNTVRLWDYDSGRLLRTLEGHSRSVTSVTWSPDGRQVASGSADNTVRLWAADTSAEFEVQQMRLPTHYLLSVRFAPVEQVHKTLGKTKFGDPVLICLIGIEGPGAVKPTVRQISAKIVLVGESNVGKSCLALRLVEDRYEEQGTTHGIRLWPTAPETLHPSMQASNDETRELVLWDLGGQDEYRLVHQLFLNDTTLALLLFDPTRGEAAFEDIAEWNVRLEKQLRSQPTTKLLIGAKCDQWPTGSVDQARIDALLQNCGIHGYLPVSAKTEAGIANLRQELARHLDWKALSTTSRPLTFQRVRDVIDRHRSNGETVLLYRDLEREMQQQEDNDFHRASVMTVVDQLRQQGVLVDTQLASGERTLILQIGFVEVYAGALILAVRSRARESERGVPALEISEILGMKAFPGIAPESRLPPLQERIVLECVIQLLLSHGLCFQHEGLLIFPTLFADYAASSDEGAKHTISLYYDFSGAIDNIYSSLVVRLSLSRKFGRVRLWKNRAEYDQPEQGVCGLNRVDRKGGLAHLDLFFGETTSQYIRQLFTSIVEDHLREQGVTIKEVLAITCGKCGYILDESLVRDRIEMGKSNVNCPRCDHPDLPVVEGARKARDSDGDAKEHLIALRSKIEDTGREEVVRTQQTIFEVGTPKDLQEPIRILHLSDLHFQADSSVAARLEALVQDLGDSQGGLGFDRLDYMVISGDIANFATAKEFELAHEFLSQLMQRMKLTAARCVIVPGNHDLSWEEQVYQWQPGRKVDLKKIAERHRVAQGDGYLVRSEEVYPKRFENFRVFYHQLLQQPYPLKASQQVSSMLFEEARLQFLALNSATEIDEYYRERSSINLDALANGLREADNHLAKAKEEKRLAADAKVLRIAVWHHPVTGNEKIQDDAFLEQLRKANYKLCLHGHVHEDRADQAGYLHPRKVYIAGAGSFGAKTSDRPESMPGLYNVIEIPRDHSRIRVYTRCRMKQGGPWESWAVWPGESPHQKLSYYDIPLA